MIAELVDCGLHPVDNDSGDGDIEPDGEGIACHFFVDREAACERKEEGDEDQWERQHRKNDVGGQELPVKRPPGAEAIEMGLAMKIEIDEVGDKEDRREEECGEHRRAVLCDAAGADEAVSEDQRDGREGVEDCVDQRERAQLSSCDVGRGVKVDEPADERAGDGADRDDGGNDCGWSADLVVLQGVGWGRTWH